MSGSDDPGRVHVGARVKQRRRSLRLSISKAASIAGMDRATWTGLEEATRATRDEHWAGVEQALRWVPGSFEHTLAGGEPTLIESEDPASLALDTRRETLARFPDLLALYDEMMADPRGEPADKDEVARGLLTVARHRDEQGSTGDDRRMA